MPQVCKTADRHWDTISFPVMGVVSFVWCIIFAHSFDIILIVLTSVSDITSQQPEGGNKKKEKVEEMQVNDCWGLRFTNL